MLGSAVGIANSRRSVRAPVSLRLYAPNPSAAVQPGHAETESPALRLYRQSRQLHSTSFGRGAIHVYGAENLSAPFEWDVGVHGFPGKSLEYYRLADHWRLRHHVLLVDGPAHGDSERPSRFTHDIAAYVGQLSELFERVGINQPGVRMNLWGHSVGALKVALWAAAAGKRGGEGVTLSSLNLVAGVGTLFRPYALGKDAYWGMQETLACLHPRLTHWFNSGIKELEKSYSVLFGPDWRERTELQEYVRANNGWWLRPDGKKLTWKASQLITGCSRTERRVGKGGYAYTANLLGRMGIVTEAGSEDKIRAAVAALLRATGAKIRVFIPTNDRVYQPAAQREFAAVLQGFQLPVECHEIPGGHMVLVENPTAMLQAAGYPLRA